jgi:hypothetical protein
MRRRSTPRSFSPADEFVESYVCWREEAASARGAYDHWLTARHHDEPAAFAAYMAALDREEHAADVLCESLERISEDRPG